MFTDIQMPDSMDGVALARKIERDWPGVFVIVTSGHTAPADAELSSDVPFLTKPYLLETVAALIAKTLNPQVGASDAPSEDR
jgi:DNA-binding LytR/AlgR family response regulator